MAIESIQTKYSAPYSHRSPVPQKVRRPITSKEKQLWSEMAQLLMLAGLAESSKWEAKEIIFHGGTSLHLGWASPRFSEDLDFLLNRDLLQEMGKTMGEVVERMKRYLLRLDAGLRVEMKDKSTSKMGRFTIAISKEGVLGKAVVKSEFWGVDDAYLDAYKAVPRSPILPQAMEADGLYVRMRAKMPVATLDSVFCDKIIAMAGRPYTKWRDIFDLWWISQSREFKRPNDKVLAERVSFQARAYRVDPNIESHDDLDDSEHREPAEGLAQRLRAYADRIEQPEMIVAAKEELQRFLVDYKGMMRIAMWQEGVQDMINNAAFTARHVADLLDKQKEDQLEQTSDEAPFPTRMRQTC